MATISGLQSPNPYAQAAFRGRNPAHGAPPAEHALNHAASASASYSPDWMQADNAAQAPVADIYGAKGELLKFPQADPITSEALKTGSR